MDKQAFSILEANEFLTVLAYSFDIFMITSVIDANNFSWHKSMQPFIDHGVVLFHFWFNSDHSKQLHQAEDIISPNYA